MERPALEVVFKRFDPSSSGALSLPEFLALVLFLRSATATFNAFDMQRVGVVRLNFNQASNGEDEKAHDCMLERRALCALLV